MLLTYRYPGSSVVLSGACRGKTHDPFWAALASPLSGGDLGWSSLLVDALHNNQKFSRYKESTMCVCTHRLQLIVVPEVHCRITKRRHGRWPSFGRQPQSRGGGCNAAGPWRTAKLHGYRDGGSPLRLVSVGCPRTRPSAAAAAQVQLR